MALNILHPGKITETTKATQVEAVAGADNRKYMTPLRTKQSLGVEIGQAIEAVAGQFDDVLAVQELPQTGVAGRLYIVDAIAYHWNGTGYDQIGFSSTDELSEGTANLYFTEARAKAALADELSEIGSDIAGKQPAGSYAPATGIAPSAIEGTAVVTTDARLSDARTPTTHTHAKSEVGLANVDNTSDAAKPVSGATQTALDAKLQAPFDNEIYIFDSFSETLPARRNTLWTLDFIVSGQSRTLNLPTGPLVRNGDRIGIRFTAPAGTTVNVRLPLPGSPVTIATVTAGESIIYNAVVTSLVGTTPIWQSATDLVGPIRWVLPPATPTSFNDANGAAYSPSDVAFDGSYFYIRGKKTDASPVWLRTPMSATW